MPCDPAFGPNGTRDLGARTFATGTVSVDAAGAPASYAVARGDVWAVIAARFGYDISSLGALNCAHFVLPGDPGALTPGDVVNLDLYTVASVGHEAHGRQPTPESVAACLQQTALPPQH